MGRVGSCALVVVVVNNKLYAANAGDSQALVFEQQGNELVYTKLNKKLNANSKKEQARLRALFPTESDIVECKRSEKSCYVKGRLQPTRAFGDFRLKYPEFNNPRDLGSELDYQSRLKSFTGPYITHVPEIRVIPLTKEHKVVVLGCDGTDAYL
jgi:pyruvate dehydrogenase phosphatase